MEWVMVKFMVAWPCGLVSSAEAALVLDLFVLRELPSTVREHIWPRRHRLSCFGDFLLWTLGHWLLVK